MSTPAAIAAVTRTLAGVLEAGLQDIDASCRVTTVAPDRANLEAQIPNRLNLFLVQPFHNAALRNANAHAAHRNGASARPPLAINLTYMITAYGEATPETKDQRILGRAMQLLDEHAALLPQDVRDHFPGSGLEDQLEGVRITPRDVSLEEMSRMWATFMTQYRTSAVYDVAVVLIDHDDVAPSGPPVVRRGEDDPGVFTSAGLPPLLSAATAPELTRRGRQAIHQPAVRVGETLTLEGDRLGAAGAVVEVRTPRWGTRVATLTDLRSGPDGTLQVTLADPPPEPDPPPGATPLAWAPGVHTVTLAVRPAGRPPVVSNAVPFALGPSVAVATSGGAAALTVTVDCLPAPADGQSVQLLLSGLAPLSPSQTDPPAGPGQPARLTFTPQPSPALASGSEHLAILRVDGVDSMPWRTRAQPGGATALEYDPAQQVTVP